MKKKKLTRSAAQRSYDDDDDQIEQLKSAILEECVEPNFKKEL